MGIVCVCWPVMIVLPAVLHRKERSSFASLLAFWFTGVCIIYSIQQKNMFANRKAGILHVAVRKNKVDGLEVDRIYVI